MKTRISAALAVLLSLSAANAQKTKGPVWTTAEKAAAESADFLVQGEYAGKGVGVQIAALGEGKFYLSEFSGGLPGAGWDKSAPKVSTVDTAAANTATKSLERATRKSPTLGAKAPDGAVVLFDGKANDLMKGEVKDGLLWAGAQTKGEYGSFHMHLEFRLPFKPMAPPSSQDRGNSGIYIHHRYECQVLDSFGLVYDRDQIKLPLKSDPKQWCGCFYKFKAADTPMCLPPLTWQTYDIDFTAAKFEGDTKTANARITVKHNGVLIHDDVEMPKGTGAGGRKPEIAKGPIIFQGHGNPVAYRNIWLTEK